MESGLKSRVEEKVLECLCKAEDVFRKVLPVIRMDYTLRGSCGGQYIYRRTLLGVVDQCIRVNPVLLKENADDYISQVIPHELAHYIVRSVFGRVQPHGKEWKGVMERIFGLDSDRCHTYDVSNCKRKVKRYVWGCGCKDYKVTSMKHSKYIRHLNVIGVPVGYVLKGRMGCHVCRSWEFTYKGVTTG